MKNDNKKVLHNLFMKCDVLNEVVRNGSIDQLSNNSFKFVQVQCFPQEIQIATERI